MELGHADIVAEPLSYEEWKRLRKQFRQMIPYGRHHDHCRKGWHKPECHGYGEVWSYARYATFVRRGGIDMTHR